MPRSGVTGTASQPPGTTPQQPNTVIQSAVWNAAMDDIYQIFNSPTPEAYGGTNAATFQGALNNMFDGTNTVDGVRFPATQVPSSNANTLDDYEEGSQSTAVAPATGAFGSASAIMYHTKIGRLVNMVCRVTISNVGSASGLLYVSLPYPAAVGPNVCGVGNAIRGDGVGGSVYVFGATSNAAIQTVTGASIISANVIDFSVSYITAT